MPPKAINELPDVTKQTRKLAESRLRFRAAKLFLLSGIACWVLASLRLVEPYVVTGFANAGFWFGVALIVGAIGMYVPEIIEKLPRLFG